MTRVTWCCWRTRTGRGGTPTRSPRGDLLAARALVGPEPHGRFALQAAIAAVHARASTWERTDWPLIVRLYDDLLSVWPSPVVQLNRAAAVAMADGPQAGLAVLDRGGR